jgi:hypothetical protein
MSPNPTFAAPETMEQSNLSFQLIVTNEEGISSEPDEVIITVIANSTPPPPNEEPRTIGNLIEGIIQNPLNLTNSIDSAYEIKNILTDGNRDNDHRACSLLKNLDSEVALTLWNNLNC